MISKQKEKALHLIKTLLGSLALLRDGAKRGAEHNCEAGEIHRDTEGARTTTDFSATRGPIGGGARALDSGGRLGSETSERVNDGERISPGEARSSSAIRTSKLFYSRVRR